MFHKLLLTLPFLSLLFALPAYSSDDDYTSPNYTTYPEINATLSSDFMRGFDASMVYALENDGVTYYDEDGTKEDVFTILKNHGVNWIRLRIWNNPTGDNYSSTQDNANPPTYSEGKNDLDTTVALAKRAKSAGLKLLVDFHYSDTWADPSKQYAPAAWKDVSTADSMKNKISEYTKSVLTKLKESNALPDMVQIGNEIDAGILYGNVANDNVKGDTSKHSSNFTAYLGAAASAVRDVSRDIKIMIHRSRGGQQTYVTQFFLTTLKDVDYDVAGLSYYPFFTSHGSIANLESNIKALKNGGKEVVIAETSFAWTCDWVSGKCDNQTNQLWYNTDKSNGSLAAAYDNLKNVLTDTSGNVLITSSKYDSSGNKASSGTYCIDPTVKNQAMVVRAIIEAAASSGAEGVFYWGGDWVCANTVLSTMENQAMFDYDKHALASMNIFNVEGGGTDSGSTNSTTLYSQSVSFTGSLSEIVSAKTFTSKGVTSSSTVTINVANYTYSGNSSDNWWATIASSTSWDNETHLTWSDDIKGYTASLTGDTLSKYLSSGLYLAGGKGATASVTVTVK